MNPTDILAAIAAHNWQALVLLVAIYLRVVLSPTSAYLVNLPPNWRPLPVALAGAVVTFVTAEQAHQSAMVAATATFAGLVAAGFFDGVLAAAFGDPAHAPTWAKFVVGILDDAGKASGGGGSATAPVTPPPSAVATPTNNAIAPKVNAMRIAFAALMLVTLVACQKAINTITPSAEFATCVANVYIKEPAGTPVLTVIDDEIRVCGGDATQVINVLNSQEAPALHASVAHGGAK